MRILGIISSPRRGGNSELAVKEILSRFPEEDEKVMINLNDLNIENCKACYGCVKRGSKCRQHDDLDFVIRNVKHSDKVVVAAPTYMLGAHTSIKVVLDRLISLVSDYPDFNHTDCVIVNPYGNPGWEGMSHEDLLMFCNKLHLNVIGYEVFLATLPGDSVQGENLEKVRRLADILMSGVPDPQVGRTVGTVAGNKMLICPYCGCSVLHVAQDGSVRCGLCAGRMKLVHGPEGLDLEYDPAGNHHFTHRSLDEHVAYLAEKKKLFLETKDKVHEVQGRYSGMDWWMKPEDLK